MRTHNVARVIVTGLIALMLLPISASSGFTRHGATPVADSPVSGTPIGTPVGTPSTEFHAAERLQPTPCRWPIPDGLTEGTDLVCADLSVPAYHGEFGTPYLWLHTIRLFATGDAPRDEPLIYLSGGPGMAGGVLLERFAPAYPDSGASLRSLLVDQDVILFDQRGTGASDPALTCAFDDVPITAPSPWFTPATPVALGTPIAAPPIAPPANPLGDRSSAVIECLKGYEQRGIDLAAFTTAQGENDVLRLIRALEVQHVDLLASDTGTVVAQLVMQHAPEHIRSVVLSAPLPLRADYVVSQAIAFDEALTAIFAACTADAACATANPDLETRLTAAVESLEANPVMLTPNIGDVVVTGDTFLTILYRLAHEGRADEIPPLITALASEEIGVLADYLELLLPLTGLSSGTQAVVACHDFTTATSSESIRNEIEAAGVRSVLTDHQWGSVSDLEAVCAEFGLVREDIETIDHAEADTPLLLLRGELDPTISVSDVESIAATFPQAELLVVPGAGVDLFASDNACVLNVITAFLKEPSSTVAPDCLS